MDAEFRSSAHREIIEQQIQDCRGTIEAMHIKLRQAVADSKAKKTQEYSAWILNLAQALTIMDNHLVAMVGGAYEEQGKHLELTARQANLNAWLKGGNSGPKSAP